MNTEEQEKLIKSIIESLSGELSNKVDQTCRDYINSKLFIFDDVPYGAIASVIIRALTFSLSYHAVKFAKDDKVDMVFDEILENISNIKAHSSQIMKRTGNE